MTPETYHPTSFTTNTDLGIRVDRMGDGWVCENLGGGAPCDSPMRTFLHGLQREGG